MKLDDFRLLKYPGSESPSSYESDITINDPKNEFSSSYNIFMNNVVDYGGYRFFSLAMIGLMIKQKVPVLILTSQSYQ